MNKNGDCFIDSYSEIWFWSSAAEKWFGHFTGDERYIPPNDYQWIIHNGKNVIKDNVKVAKVIPKDAELQIDFQIPKETVDYPIEIERLEENIGLLFDLFKARTSDANNK